MSAEETDVPNTPDDETVANVAAEMIGPSLQPLSDEERLEQRLRNQFWRDQCRARDEEMAREYQRAQAVKEQAAERERRIAREHELNKARHERHEQIARQTRERELWSLRLQVTQQGWWQRNVDAAARNAVAVQQRQALIAELDGMINPPPLPEPEPQQIIYIEQSDGSPHLGPDYNPKLAGQAVLRWW